MGIRSDDHSARRVEEGTFVSSANFTQRGEERNINVGVLVKDASFASYLAGHWIGLVEAGMAEAHRLGA